VGGRATIERLEKEEKRDEEAREARVRQLAELLRQDAEEEERETKRETKREEGKNQKQKEEGGVVAAPSADRLSHALGALALANAGKKDQEEKQEEKPEEVYVPPANDEGLSERLRHELFQRARHDAAYRRLQRVAIGVAIIVDPVVSGAGGAACGGHEGGDRAGRAGQPGPPPSVIESPCFRWWCWPGPRAAAKPRKCRSSYWTRR
jgi:hypothetical protein